MPDDLTISLTPENLDLDTPEERATFGLLAIAANGRLLTQGIEDSNNAVRDGPYVSGYPLAEWLAWNWWRIRWEFDRPSEPVAGGPWAAAHRMPAAGDGYLWPDITISSDGMKSFLNSRRSSSRDGALFRYLGAEHCEEVPAPALEEAVDGFVRFVLSRLDDGGLHDTSLHRVWNDLRTERTDPELSRYRKLEAQLGYDPDEADEDAMLGRLGDSAALGEGVMGELAADAAMEDDPLRDMVWSRELSDVAERRGFDADPDSGLELSDAEVSGSPALPRPGAWARMSRAGSASRRIWMERAFPMSAWRNLREPAWRRSPTPAGARGTFPSCWTGATVAPAFVCGRNG